MKFLKYLIFIGITLLVMYFIIELISFSIVIINPTRKISNYHNSKKGYYPENNYVLDYPFKPINFLRGVFVSKLTDFDVIASTIEIDIATEKLIESKQIFMTGENVLIYIYKNNKGLPTEYVKIKGSIISIGNNSYPNSDTLYTSLRIRVVSGINEIKETYQNSNYLVSIQNSSLEDITLAIDDRAIRKIGQKEYICMVTDKIFRPGLELSDNLIKFELKEIQKGERIYSDTSGFYFLRQINDEFQNSRIVISKDEKGTNNYNFECGKIVN